MQFVEKKRVKKKKHQRKREGSFPIGGSPTEKGGRRNEKRLSRSLSTSTACVPSSCSITREGKERKRYTYYYLPSSPFPFSKDEGEEEVVVARGKKWKQRLLLSTGPRAFFTKKFPFISLRVPLFVCVCVCVCACDLGNFTCISTKKCSITLERLTGKEYHSTVLRPNSPTCSKRYLDRWNLPIEGRSSMCVYLHLTKCLVIRF